MVMAGLNTALDEITLVFFTTLAPSGVVAFIVMGLPLVRGRLSSDVRHRINQCLCIPLVISMVGLVASATHLGSPANALYVFMGVGRSPLSNEVFCAVVFLALAGVYWLYSFSVRPSERLSRWWVVLALVAGVVFVTAVSVAYDAPTIVSWATPFVPLALWLNALVGGPILALAGLSVARFRPVEQRFGRVLIGVSAAALAANLVVYVLQGLQLPAMENAFATAAQLVPYYGGMVVAFALAAGAGLVVAGRPLWRRSADAPSADVPSAEKLVRLTILRTSAASALVLVGIFIMRFAFYMMHLTVGLSL